MPKFYGLIDSPEGTGIFYGDWRTEVEPISHCINTGGDENYEGAKKKLEAQLKNQVPKITVSGYKICINGQWQEAATSSSTSATASTSTVPRFSNKYFEVHFNGDSVRKIVFKDRYPTDDANTEMEKQFPQHYTLNRRKEGYEICHKKSVYTIKREIEAMVKDKSCDEVIEKVTTELRQLRTKVSDTNSSVTNANAESGEPNKSRVEQLLLELYKARSMGKNFDNLFVDSEINNRAFGLISQWVQEFDDKNSSRGTISKDRIPVFRKIIQWNEGLKDIIFLKTKDPWAKVTEETIDTLRLLADSHYQFYLYENPPQNNATASAATSTSIVSSSVSATTSTSVVSSSVSATTTTSAVSSSVNNLSLPGSSQGSATTNKRPASLSETTKSLKAPRTSTSYASTSDRGFFNSDVPSDLGSDTKTIVKERSPSPTS